MTRRLFGMNATLFGLVMAIVGVLLLMLWLMLCMYDGVTPGFAGISGGMGLGAYTYGMTRTFVAFSREPGSSPRS